ncbi:arachidonate 15-lipoxygenase B [Larimichthys crocea]|uniref:arachidonate 15-lipoxygenase B n=1 Tax=Larimichthys crocea TaxID=215358 RepID=UPI000F5FBB45|nr:arachidonate 15-lipoxygenase B-like [Larimichthys crocea]
MIYYMICAVAMVIYRVVVYQEGMFLSSDAHRTVIQLVGSRGVSERVPLAERFICRLLKNSCFCCKSTKEEAEYMVHCPTSLGALLLVHLEAPPTTDSIWFCSKVVVTTPEGGVSLFPCYRFVSRSTSLALRDSIAKFIFHDVQPLQLDQRVNELTERRRTYRWSCYDDGLPETMKANDIMSLPAEARFSVSKATDMILTVSKVLVELSLQSFLSLQNRWSGFHQIHQLCQWTRTRTSRLVEHLWMEDWFFGHQFLNGANPTLIRRCTEIPPNMAVTEETVGASLGGGASLCQEMERGNMFLVDYRLLDTLTANTVNRKQNYLTAPLILLHLNARNQLLPIAIQLKQSPGESNPVFVPQDLEADWLTAKTFVRSADFADHELRSHFLHTHVMSELFAMATLRNFPMVHPLYKDWGASLDGGLVLRTSFLNGANPTLIRRCTKSRPTWPLPRRRGASLGGGASVSGNGERKYVLGGLSAAGHSHSKPVNRKQNYLTAPLILLHLTRRNQLLPSPSRLKVAQPPYLGPIGATSLDVSGKSA